MLTTAVSKQKARLCRLFPTALTVHEGSFIYQSGKNLLLVELIVFDETIYGSHKSYTKV